MVARAHDEAIGITADFYFAEKGYDETDSHHPLALSALDIPLW